MPVSEEGEAVVGEARLNGIDVEWLQQLRLQELTVSRNRDGAAGSR